MGQWVFAIFHLIDLGSDLSYVSTVKFVSPNLLAFMLVSLVLPYLLLCVFYYRRGDDLASPFIAFLSYFGLLDLIANENTGEEAEIDQFKDYKAVLLMMFALIEDLPQFLMQGLNTILQKEPASAIQIISPFISFIGICFRSNLYVRDYRRDDGKVWYLIVL